MKDWNTVVTVYQDGFRRALRALQKLAPAERSPYHNVLEMKADDPLVLLDAIEAMTQANPALYDAISRVAPAARVFDFASEEECVERAKSILADWVPRLAGRTFHARWHRRGTEHTVPTQDAERRLDDAVIAATAAAGAAAKISFTDPDMVIAVDIIDDRAGIGLWTRADLERYHVLRPD